MKQSNLLATIDRIDIRLAEITAEGYQPRLHLHEWSALCTRRWKAYAALDGGWHPSVSTSEIRLQDARQNS